MQKKGNIWEKWALTAEELREVFNATRERHNYDDDDDYDDDDADCICD